MRLTGQVTTPAGPLAATLDVAVAASGPARFTDLFGTAPTGHMLVIDQPTLLDADVTVNGLHIESELIFPADVSRTLTSDAHSVMVSGTLTMRPSSADVVHTVRFVNIDESTFVGGDGGDHHTDPGLMFHDGGVWDGHGTPRTPWARLAGAAAKSATTLLLDRDVTGWRVGDEIAVVPSEAPSVTGHYDHYDTRTVTAIQGRTVTVAALTYPHPTCTLPDGRVMTAEVLNLTRNVRVEGTPTGRTHIMSHGRLNVSDIGIRYTGPRQPTGERDFTAGVLGRYGLHFHEAGDASRGSTVDSAVVRDSGFRGFVPHASHGVEFHGCVVHNAFDGGFWWDQGSPGVNGPATNDLTWDDCVASRITVDPPFRGNRLAGFTLGAGTGTRCHGSVAVGVQGNTNASGFLWPEASLGVWDFADSVSHNNAFDGIFTWQNTSLAHTVLDTVCYRNGRAGIEHGAYNNGYDYERMQLVENKVAGIALHALSRADVALRFRQVDVSGSPLGVSSQKHVGSVSPVAVTFDQCRFIGCTTTYEVSYDGNNGASTAEHTDLVDCSLSGTPVVFRAGAPAGSVVRVIQAGQTVATYTV